VVIVGAALIGFLLYRKARRAERILMQTLRNARQKRGEWTFFALLFVPQHSVFVPNPQQFHRVLRMRCGDKIYSPFLFLK
jgi:hypothetical protein